MEQAQGKSVVLTCNVSKSAKQAIDKVNWTRVTQGSLQTLLAASIVVVGITAVVATGGLAGAAIAGIASGSGVSAVGAAAIGTFMTGSATAVMGTADVVESGTDVFYGLSGSNKESVHLIRDNIQYFRDNPDSYYLLEAMLGTTAGAGTATLSPFMVKNNRQEASISEKPNKTSKLYEAPDGGGGITDRIKIENIEVSFGHGDRHLDGTGVSLLDVNQAIANDVVSKHGGTG